MDERERIRAGLEEFHSSIAQAIDLAWQEWRFRQRVCSEHGLPPPLYRRTASNHVFDAVTRQALRIMSAHPRAHVRIEAQTVKYHFINKSLGGGVLARFKAGNENKLSQNWKTQAVLNFLDPEMLPYPDLPKDTQKVDIVWTPNDLRTDYEGIYVVARDGDEIVWDYEIPRWQSDAGVVPFPIRPSGPHDDDDQISDLIVPKRPGSEAGAEDDQT